MDAKNRKHFSLAFKQHILIISIVTIVAAVLVTISYRAFTKITFDQIYERLDEIGKKGAYNQEFISYDCSLIIDITASDEYQKARSEAETGKDIRILITWYSNYMFNEEDHELITDKEYKELLKTWADEAALAGVDTEDDIVWDEWVALNHPEYINYCNTNMLFEETHNLVRDEADLTGVSDIAIYAEEADHIALMISAASVSEEDTLDEDFLNCGERFDHVEVIDAFF